MIKNMKNGPPDRFVFLQKPAKKWRDILFQNKRVIRLEIYKCRLHWVWGLHCLLQTYVPESNENVPAPAAYVKNGALYITYDDLCGGVCCAGNSCISRSCCAGCSFNGNQHGFSRPVGTIISGILAVAAAPSLTELCGRVIYAIATKQGIYIKPVLAYPPLKMGYF